MMFPYISAYALSDYILCRRRIYYRLSNDDVVLDTNEDQALGNLIHFVLAENPETQHKMLRRIQFYAETAGLSDYVLSNAAVCTHNYFKYFKDMTSDSDIKELYFNIPYKNTKIVGSFDRIIKDNTIIEWKVGVGTHNLNIQLALYDYAYRKKFNAKPKILVCDLLSGETVVYKSNKLLTFLLFRSIIPSYLKDYKYGNFTPTGLFTTGVCSACVYKSSCHKDLQEDMENVMANTKFNYKQGVY